VSAFKKKNVFANRDFVVKIGGKSGLHPSPISIKQIVDRVNKTEPSMEKNNLYGVTNETNLHNFSVKI